MAVVAVTAAAAAAGAHLQAPLGFPAPPRSKLAVAGFGRRPRFQSLRAAAPTRAGRGNVLDEVRLCQVLVEKQQQQQQQQRLSGEREGFWGRLSRAWRILFPPMHRPATNAQVAKRRLKMILISDRCSVNDVAKRKIVDNIVGALADFVEIESEENVALNVSSDSQLGTVYYVTVPVRRVRPEYQDFSNELHAEDIFTPT